PVAAIAVEIREGASEPGNWKPQLGRLGDDVPPARLGLANGSREKRVEEQVFEARVPVERPLDVFQEPGADDAASAPQERNVAVVQLPLELARRRFQLYEALGIAADLRRVQRLPDILDEFVAVPGVLLRGRRKDLRRPRPRGF